MGTANILAQVNREIERLERVKALLVEDSPSYDTEIQKAPRVTRGRRQMSPEAKARIREAQRRRWATERGEETPATAPETTVIGTLAYEPEPAPPVVEEAPAAEESVDTIRKPLLEQTKLHKTSKGGKK